MSRIALIAVAVLMAACTALTTSPLPQQPIDRSFKGYLASWDGEWDVIFAYKVFEQDGFAAVCGAWSSNAAGALDVTFDEMLIGNGRLTASGDTLVTSISWFSRAGFVQDRLPEGTANCVLTDEPWDAARFARDNLDLVFARSRFVLVD